MKCFQSAEFKPHRVIIVFHQVLLLYETYHIDCFISLVPYDWYPNFTRTSSQPNPVSQRVMSVLDDSTPKATFRLTVAMHEKMQPNHSSEWGQSCRAAGVGKKRKCKVVCNATSGEAMRWIIKCMQAHISGGLHCISKVNLAIVTIVPCFGEACSPLNRPYFLGCPRHHPSASP